jgi:3-deoxy-D-manno-octulosonic-acid transferase
MLGNKSIRMVIVPHHVSNDNISDMADLIQSNSMSFELLSDLEILSLDGKVSGCQVVLVDSIGRLFELYGIASLAFIGGAMHAKVHNVLEPAAWGVPMSSGPMVSNSQEAQHFLKRGLLEIVDSPDQLYQTWTKQLKNHGQISQDLLQEVKILCGASQAFFETLKRVLGIV